MTKFLRLTMEVHLGCISNLALLFGRFSNCKYLLPLLPIEMQKKWNGYDDNYHNHSNSVCLESQNLVSKIWKAKTEKVKLHKYQAF
ncbi:hypothetical protein EV194_103294 [Natronoflexus pectinivorans]|uniref:Uncharacterized protein n=1 Tax=Natronoflexus pectinivorans TaxID=682526 RepID=A0A4R2GKJ7_9BACT|nr:hypothetical protein EV194_103294 [Natronoflexus pectinivorans]